jgi:hypothetical protein
LLSMPDLPFSTSVPIWLCVCTTSYQIFFLFMILPPIADHLFLVFKYFFLSVKRNVNLSEK